MADESTAWQLVEVAATYLVLYCLAWLVFTKLLFHRYNLANRWVKLLFCLVFSLGAALAAFSGMIDAPLSSVYPGMGDFILIISFVVIVIGGIGSVKGAFVGAMLVGLVDTFGKILVPEFASMSIYALMAVVLLWRPQGLFGRPA